jgi:hypothetical protein
LCRTVASLPRPYQRPERPTTNVLPGVSGGGAVPPTAFLLRKP